MEYIKTAGAVLSVIIQCGTIVTLLYALTRFLSRPNTTQNERIDALESDVRNIKIRIEKGNKHFAQIDDGSKVMQKALLALIDHAIDNNHVEKLVEAKDDLQAYLIDK